MSDLQLGKYRVVVRYDNGSVYRGPIMDNLDEAKKKLEEELAVVHGTAFIERV